MSDELNPKCYPEDERLRQIRDDPNRQMTRAEWEREESQARQAAQKRHQQVEHDREVQQEFDKKNHRRHRDWKKVLLWVGGGVLVLFLIFVLGYLPHRAQARKAAALARQRQQEEPEVQVVKVKRTSAPAELTVPGTTSALTVAFLYARANGYLRKRYCDIGDRVHKGQILALIDAPDLDQQVDQARQQLRQAEAQRTQQKAQLDLSRVTWERWRTLVAKKVFSRQDGDQREADFLAQLANMESAERNVQSYRANLERVLALQQYERITAPFDGVITQRNTDVGALVGAAGSASPAPMPSSQASTGGSAGVGSSNTAGTSGISSQAATPSTGEAQGGPIFGVARLDKLRILVSVPEGYASSIQSGMPAKVFVQERVGKPIEGTVTRISNSLDQNTRTMLTEVDIDNPDGRLYPGIYAVVSFVQVRGVSPIVVPGDAVVVRQDRTTVATVRDQRIAMAPVEIGRDYGPSVEILSGLDEGDLVVTSVTDSVQPGVKVRTREKKEAGEENSASEGAQTNRQPASSPNQYGDQAIVDSSSESTNQKGKPAANGQAEKPGGKQQGQGKDKQNGSKQKDDRQGDQKK
jgi:multidrug efflux pump subunit AcrA (membrane-fusion protein)